MGFDDNDIRPAIISQTAKTILTAIERLGFPIFVSICFMYLNLKMNETISALQVTLAKQTVILQAVSDRLGLRIVHDAPPEQRP